MCLRRRMDPPFALADRYDPKQVCKSIHAKSDLPKMRFKAQIRGKSIDVPSLMHIITLGKDHHTCVCMTQKYQ